MKYVPVYLVGIVVAASLVAGVCGLFALGVGFVAGYVTNIFENLPWLLSIFVPSAVLLGASIAWAAIRTRSDGARIVIVLVSTNIKKVDLVDFEQLGMEAIRKIEVVDFPAFIIVDDKGNDFCEGL